MSELVPLGDAALQIVVGEGIDPLLNRRVLALSAELAEFPGLIDRVPAYASLTIHYDPLVWNYADLVAAIRPLLDSDEEAGGVPRLLSLPVCYGGEYGPDLDEVARHCGLSADRVVALHSAAEYRVYFLGFTPGFPYLGGLAPALATPRRATPRPGVPAGCVGIADAQTGIYPLASPGGWQLIGRTPLRLFDPRRSSPCWLAPGDILRFQAIDAGEFARLAAAEDR